MSIRRDFDEDAQAELAYAAADCQLCTATEAPHDSDCPRIRARSSALFTDAQRAERTAARRRSSPR